jgi:glucose/arabinose dehydrogenase/cytochrome c551/c552
MKTSKQLLFLCSLIFLFALNACSDKREGPPKILVFSKTMGFRHTSIPAGIERLKAIALEEGYVIDTTENAEHFNEKNLEQYSAVVFLSTTGNVLNAKQEAAFERYIQAGGGYVGVHAASDTEYDWKWYGQLVGGYFESHPEGLQKAQFDIVDSDFVATKFFGQTRWDREDEIYNFRTLYQGNKVLVKVDEGSYEGGNMQGDHPISWYKEYDGGRSFYTALGHTEASYEESAFIQHLKGGLAYAIGKNKRLNYKKCSTEMPPDADRFTKRVLHKGSFFEPTEMTLLPGGEVLIAQRRGEIMRYNPASGELTEVAKLAVYSKSLENPNVNVEEGLMGLQKDPDYAKNHWVYVYYSPAGKESVNRLSRFQYKEGQFEIDSEQHILDVGSDREVCCHTGGSIAFDSEGLLYLSTGDNSTPFDEPNVEYVNNGYAPLNDLPGKSPYDARRSSGNTNDLRGKILRIKVEEDGSYSIPPGNLFAQGNAQARPEIYTMGHRNPYRISVDPVNGYVYWGEIGPDAPKDNLEFRGPRGYDEINQAKGPGNFGWPLFIADNQPYVAYDYGTGESGAAYDPASPRNTSQNNTGLTELPPAQGAMIYYPYAAFGDFPQLEDGSRNAMAGPVFYKEIYPNSTSLPEYFDGKLLVYDWMRGWVFTVHFFEDGSFKKMEPFAPQMKLNGLIDMELDAEGKLYFLEYGNGWFSQNDDSALSVIDFFGGNRPPVVDEVRLSKTSGLSPLAVEVDVLARDREGDALRYTVDFGDGETAEGSSLPLRHTYNKKGEFELELTVSDDRGAAVSQTEKIIVGNSMPEVSIEVVEGNSQFILPGQAIQYKVQIADAEDNQSGALNPGFVSLDYFESPDEVQQNLGHQEVKIEELGRQLTQELDCKTCHKEREPSIGPSYTEISAQYAGVEKASDYLGAKIKNGGSGVWGPVAMPAHPNLSAAELRQMVSYIESLQAPVAEEDKSLPHSGHLTFEPEKGYAVLKASYTDKGADQVPPLSQQAQLVFKPAQLDVNQFQNVQGFSFMVFNDTPMYLFPQEEGQFEIKGIDLTGVKALQVVLAWQNALNKEINLGLTAKDQDGKVVQLSNQLRPSQVAGSTFGLIQLEVSEKMRIRGNDLTFTFKNALEENQDPVQAVVLRVELIGE